MATKVSVSIYHDTRYRKAGGGYPVKLQVYFDGAQRYYPTNIDVSKEDFERSYLAVKPKQEYREMKIRIDGHLTRAVDIVEDIAVFSFETFERRLGLGKNVDNVITLYEEVIAQKNKDEDINTADNYSSSLRSILLFELWNNGITIARGSKQKADEYLQVLKDKVKRLPLQKITPQYLREYEKWHINECGNNRTTVGIYLRPLRAIYLSAIGSEFVDKAYYPFALKGEKNKYKIPAGRKVKKALGKEELSILFHALIPEEQAEIIKARDFWFFSYNGNGMNVADYSRLRYSNIKGGEIHFIRKKTAETTKDNVITITVQITPFLQSIIDKYGNKDTRPDNYIFSIIDDTMKEREKVKKIMAFTRFVNQHMKRLAETIGITTDISSNWGRHSMTTLAVNEAGASLEEIREMLGHTSSKTTANYFAGFTNEKRQKLASQLMDFTKPATGAPGEE